MILQCWVTASSWKLPSRKARICMCCIFNILALDAPGGHTWSWDITAGLGSNTFYRIQIQIQIHFFQSFKYKYKYKYTGKNLIKYKYSLSNTNTIQIHTEAETKLSPFYRWHIQIHVHSIVRKLFYLFKFRWKLFPKAQSTISLAACIGSSNGLALSRQQAIIWPMMARITDA